MYNLEVNRVTAEIMMEWEEKDLRGIKHEDAHEGRNLLIVLAVVCIIVALHFIL